MTANVYRKRGRVVRFEDGTLLNVAERGRAWEREGVFFCEPEPGEHLPPIEPQRVLATAEAIRQSVPAGVAIERLIVSEGRAEHSLGAEAWSDRSERIHVSLLRGALRVVVDVGSFDLGDVHEAGDALARAEQREDAAPRSLRLAPAVSAAVVAELAAGGRTPVAIVQSAGGVDGTGAPILEWPVDRQPWPNWYRPSYRFRPQRSPMNVRALCDASEIDAARPRAVALLEPPHGSAARVLVDDGARVYPCSIEIAAIRAMAAGAVWYPFGAGSFGAEMML